MVRSIGSISSICRSRIAMLTLMDVAQVDVLMTIGY
jgi:hypothetical protein